MRKRRLLLWFIFSFLIMAQVSCTKSSINTPSSSLEAPFPMSNVSVHTDMSEPLHFYDESVQKGAYVRSEYVYQNNIMRGQIDTNTIVGLYYDNDEKYLLQAKNGDLTDFERIPGYDWLSTDKFCKEHYINDYLLTDSGELVCGVAPNGWDGKNYYEIKGSSSVIVGDAHDFEVAISAGEGLLGDYCTMVFDPVHPERCVIVSNLDENKQITFYNWKTREIISAGPMDTYCWPRENELAILGDVLCYYARTNLRMYRWDMNTGEPLETVEFFDSASVTIRDNYETYAIGETNDGKGLLLVDGRGIYYLDPEQDFAETLILPGKNQPFSAPNVIIADIQQFRDGSIFLHCIDTTKTNENDDPPYGIYRLLYTYDPDYDRRASSLEVYSLERNQTLAQAVSVYTENSPDADVDYVVGTEGGLSSADALTSLTTRILAGSGPDVLLMDGLPLASYMEKGALADISELLPPEEECYSAIVNAYKQPDGKVYAAPARFSVPTLLGKNVADVKTLPELAAWADTFEQKDFGVGSLGAMHSFFPLYAKDWIVNGEFQADVFRTDLEAMGAISEQWHATTSKPIDRYQYGGEGSFQAYYWYAGDQCGAFGDYRDIGGLARAYSAIYELGGELALFGDNMFYPLTIVAQSSASRHPQEARVLIETLLGQEVQSAQMSDGFSVLRSVVEGQKECPYGEDYKNEMKISWISAVPEVTLVERWPKKRDIDAFVSAFDTLTVPANVDYTLRDLFIEETLPYLLGEESIDSCMQRLTSKIAIYLAE